MNTILAIAVGAALLVASVAASAAPEITGSAQVTVSGNKAKNIVAAGGNVEASGLTKLVSGSVSLTGVANVNSLVVNDGKVAGRVTITKNEADGVYAIGGTANVNSVVLGK